jgi:SNF2 family DNA or RNA helicase
MASGFHSTRQSGATSGDSGATAGLSSSALPKFFLHTPGQAAGGLSFQQTAGGGYSWQQSSPPRVSSVDLSFDKLHYLTNWDRADALPEAVSVRTLDLKWPPPRVVSIPFVRPALRIRSFTFAEHSGDSDRLPWGVSSDDGQRQSSQPDSTTRPAVTLSLAGSTRVKPPGDVIKLEDRLRYLLQPSLEAMLTERSMEFPFHPFPYQFEGIAFLYARHSAILADEMGLGKTMQAITAVRLLLRSAEVRSVLLVCPKPLVSNWQREFDLWAPEIPILTIEGDQARRRWQWELPGMPVKIANYELLHRDREIYEGRDHQGKPLVHFDLAVLDESQRIKNRASATSRAARAISRSRNWALTGTPVENSSEDLVGIFEFLAPGFLSSEMRPRRMGRMVGDYVLRRTKDRVLTDLPPKLFHDEEFDLTPEQRQTYDMAEQDGVLRLGDMGQAATIHHVFELVLRLKQICNFDPATGSSVKLQRLAAGLEEVAASGRKAIVFSQWVDTLKRLSRRLDRFGPLEYHGGIPSRQRDGVIRQFREDPSRHVMLISYGAGGVGLNLQFASYVFLFDRWWNPAVEDQAINRAHRIGTTGPVTVTRFLTLATIEERIDRVLQEKRELFDTIFSGTEPHRKLGLTQEELFGLFELKSPAGPIDFAA